jgi:hypothetical protein
MTRLKSILRLSLVLSMSAAGYVWAQDRPQGTAGQPASQPPARTDRESLPHPVYRVAQKTTDEAGIVPGAHPLEPALEIAHKCLDHIQNEIKDYSATLVKQERIDGKLNDPEYLFIKVRHQPFSVYTYFKAPENMKGQEATYVEGKNDGKLLAHGVGIRKLAGTVALEPNSMLAMQGQRYPITEIGIYNLTKRLIEVADADKKFGECEVKFFKGAKINQRPCTCIQVIHPTPRRNFRFHMARVFVDDEMNVPVRYEAYEWPATEGGKPPLLESYTYVDVKLNNGFTDIDFDVKNPAYGY